MHKACIYMKNLSIDIETYSPENLAGCGVYRYAQSPGFRILLFGYSIDGGPVNVVDMECGEAMPEDILRALTDAGVMKHAFNATFERVCLSGHLGLPAGDYLDPSSWRCTMVHCAYMGLPLSLEGAGTVLGLDRRKLAEGRDLIRYFCSPCLQDATLFAGAKDRHLPMDSPDRWESFKAYNLRDVEAELEIQSRLSRFPVPDTVWDEYCIDQRINDRGVMIDTELVRKAIEMDTVSRAELMLSMRDRTGLENPNSAAQMKKWLADRGLRTGTLGKKAVAVLMKTAAPDMKETLELRQQLAKSSVRKYKAMSDAVCGDSRARGMFQFYGANRTGRWAGRLIQMQNLPQNHLEDLETARMAVRECDYETVKALYSNVPDTLSQLIRTAFVPRPGTRFIVADFAAIEARVIAWMAGERWRLEVFGNGGDIYCASASRMFKVPVVRHGVNGHLRQKGKIAELALGYGGSTGALKAMGALEMGLQEDELQGLVSAWRISNPEIVRLWRDVDKAAVKAVKGRTDAEARGLRFSCRSGMLFITLPSGRRLSYVKPRMGQNAFGSESITYEGTGSARKWERIETYGPKLVENIVQGLSRDILCHAMRALERTGHRIVMHIHDECVMEAPPDVRMDEVCRIMGMTPPWAEGLVLRADGYETDFYRKD